MRHIGVLWILGDAVDPALRAIWPGLNSCAIARSCRYIEVCYGKGRVRPMHLVNYTVRSESDGMLTLFRAAMPPGRSKR